ncbi:MAG: nucleoside triphosphate pyrophosphohydrolase family protein [Bacteroidota bacterium]
MKNKIEAVQKFHKTFGLGVRNKPTSKLSDDLITLRYNLMVEENKEYLEAAKNNDLIEVADALGDMLYIIFGTILEHGLQDKMEAVFDEIQRSNMSKMGKDGKPVYREDGKIMKGSNYFEPDIKGILKD